MLETTLEAEMGAHPGYHNHDATGRDRANSRNGARAKTVLTEIGPVQTEVPRDRDGTYEPAIVRKRQRRLDGIDQIVLSLTTRGLATESTVTALPPASAGDAERHDWQAN